MKSKLAKSREKGRHGWQTASAAYLSSLLYHHMYKADPLDVANLAMMLHQNGQAIELPQEARRDQGFNKSSEVQRLREALKHLLSYAERQICEHEETHRGGAIWEICDMCGAKWADDEGGKPEFKWPDEIKAAHAAMLASTEGVKDE